MATTIIKVSGSGTVYTVPTGKIAKVIIDYVYLNNYENLSIGGYEVHNGAGGYVWTSYTSQYSGGTNTGYPPTQGWLSAGTVSNDLTMYRLYIRQEHILTEGETIETSSSGTVKATIIEEDV